MCQRVVSMPVLVDSLTVTLLTLKIIISPPENWGGPDARNVYAFKVLYLCADIIMWVTTHKLF